MEQFPLILIRDVSSYLLKLSKFWITNPSYLETVKIHAPYQLYLNKIERKRKRRKQN